MQPNVEFHYLYRDGGNYKTFGSMIVSNRMASDLYEIDELLKQNLIDGQFFYTQKVHLPALYNREFPFDPEVDSSWHEFESVTETTEPISDPLGRDIFDLVGQLSH